MKQDQEESFSGRFQIRIYPETHKVLSEYARAVNGSMSGVIELALGHCLWDEEFRSYADDYFNGTLIVVENGMPKAHLVRRNFLSYVEIDLETVNISIRVLQGSVWKKWSFNADLKQNPTLLEKLKSWSR
ncbi:hypothetical protein JK191_14290 [Gluconobacter sphaericus]|uniref:hypothetical protein n=1 Tax=Gluconobacter sphaericus TaxID=574987 RepID=UPI001B8AFDBF|nr:hypothetical protein [Gluconobacter sphaericus]MBS1098675.1 hypothetical protein [Gluconobacter sphaericus]